MRAATDRADIAEGLLALSSDPAVTQVLARTRRDAGGRDSVTVEVTRNGSAVREPLIQEPAELVHIVSEFLGPGRTCGSVSVRGLQGIAAVPPSSDMPLLALERFTPAKAAPDRDNDPAGIAKTAAAILGAGAGVVVAGPSGNHIGLAIRTIVTRLGPSSRLVMIEDGPPIPVRRDAIRLREAPCEVVRALRHCVIIFHRSTPPTLPALSGAVLVVVSARTPEGALARLVSGASARPAVLARLCSDAAPLFLWSEPGSQSIGFRAVYEILPDPAAGPAGLPALQMLAGTDPETGALIPTGAVPVDATIRAAFNLS